MELPDLDSLRCFDAAATLLNSRAAARAVALSPSALSERIRLLEEKIGTPLFARTTRQVRLTPAGERLVPRARKALEEAGRCLEVAGARPLPFELTVGTRFELGLSWLTPALSVMKAAKPERSLHLYFGDSEQLLQQIRRGAVDCAVSSVRLTSGDFRYEVLHEERYALVAAPKLLARQPFSVEQTSQHALLDLHPDLPLFRYLLDARPHSERWAFQRTEYLGTIAAVRHRALEGAGVAVLPRYFIREDLVQKRLSEPMPRARLHVDYFRLIWRVGHRREGEIRQLAEELRALPLR